MKKVTRTIMVSCLALVLLAGGGLTTAEKTIIGFSSTGRLTVTAKVWFNPSWKIISGSGYGLKTGKHVKQAYVRIQEGDYDSGRVYTSAAPNKSTNREYSKSLSKTNNPFKTMHTNYGWIYF